MKHSIEKVLDDICRYVKYENAHADIRAEYLDHIETAQNEHIKNGMSEDEALDAAINDLGDIKQTGKYLNKIHKPEPSYGMRFSLSMKIMLRTPVKTTVTFLLIAAASFALFSRITDYAITSREMNRAINFYYGVAALDNVVPITIVAILFLNILVGL